MSDVADLERTARAASKYIYLGNELGIAVVLGRFKMYLHMDDVGIVPHLAIDGFWESWVTSAVLRMVRPGMRIINVGANFGYYALLFADLVGPKGHVVAVEPNPLLCEILTNSKHLNGYAQLSVLRAAASDAPGESSMVIPDGHCMNAHLAEVSGAEGRSVSTRVTTVDHIARTIPGERSDVDLVFIDAEGAEEGIWRGMKCVRASKDVTLVIEFSPGRYADAVGFAREFAADGFSLGYVGFDGSVIPSTPEALAAGPEVMAVLRRPR